MLKKNQGVAKKVTMELTLDEIDGSNIVTRKAPMPFDYRLVASSLLNARIIDHTAKLTDREIKVLTGYFFAFFVLTASLLAREQWGEKDQRRTVYDG